MISVALLLFLIMDPFGNLVIVNTLLAELSPRERVKVVLREGAIATGILLCACFFGGTLLTTLGLAEHSLRLAGGIVLFLIALGMLFPSHKMLDEPAVEAPLVVPIAMPLIAGPSAISMAVLFAEKFSITLVAGAILVAAAGTVFLLALSAQIFQLLGRRGTMAMERLMGMLLIMLSVQLILDGIEAFMNSRL